MCLAIASTAYTLFTQITEHLVINSLLAQVLMALLSFYLTLCLFALVMPKIKPGKYALGSKEVTLWFLSFNFARVWNYDPIKHPLFCFNLFRWFFLRCLGAKISFGTAVSSNVKLLDVHLLTIGPGCTLGFDSVIVPHYIIDNKLVLDPVTIGKNTLLGAETKIGPGVQLGENVTIHAATHFLPNTVIADNVTIGHHSVIGKYMQFAPGSKVPPFTK